MVEGKALVFLNVSLEIFTDDTPIESRPQILPPESSEVSKPDPQPTLIIDDVIRIDDLNANSDGPEYLFPRARKYDEVTLRDPIVAIEVISSAELYLKLARRRLIAELKLKNAKAVLVENKLSELSQKVFDFE